MIFSSLLVFAQGDNLKDVLAVANAGYKDCLEKIPNGQEVSWGFNNRDEFTIAKVGKPYQTVTLNKGFFNDTILSENNYLVFNDEWRVPIMVNGEYRTLLRVIRIKGKWEVTGLGANVLAKELGKFENEHPSVKQYGMILRVYQMVSDFILLPIDNSSSIMNIYPLASAKTALSEKENGKTFYSLSEALLLIKQHIKH